MSTIHHDPAKSLEHLLSTPSTHNHQDSYESHLIVKLKEILEALMLEKEEFAEKYHKEKQQLCSQIEEQEKKIIRISEEYAMLESKYENLEFSYDQKGSLITYLKECIAKNEVKYDMQISHLKSINAYLEGRNQYLEGIISELRRRESSYNNNYEHEFIDKEEFIFEKSSSSVQPWRNIPPPPKLSRPLTKMESDSAASLLAVGRGLVENRSCVVNNSNGNKFNPSTNYPSTVDIQHETGEYRLFFKKNKNKFKDIKTNKPESTKKVEKKARKLTGEFLSVNNFIKMSYMEQQDCEKTVKDLKMPLNSNDF